MKHQTAINFTDTHCHLDFPDFENDLDAVILEAKNAGVNFILNPGIDSITSAKAIALAKRFPKLVYAAVGFHPNYGYTWDDNSLQALSTLANDTQVLAIGEIGLDYYRQYTQIIQQQKIFKEQLSLAEKLELPVLIHCRESIEDVMDILKQWHNALPNNSRLKVSPGVFHAYSDSVINAGKIIDLNFMLGIGGPVTFLNADDRKEVVRNLPLESILLETDAPFLTPHPFRGRRNKPSYIPLIANEIASVKNISIEEVSEITYNNAKKVFNF
jgi:TatD DNase family protein